MADKVKYTTYDALRAAIKSGNISRCYAFFGEERYLLESSLEALREKLIAPGAEAFDLRRLDGARTSLAELSGAAETVPALSGRVLVEVRDYPLFPKRGADAEADGDDDAKAKKSAPGELETLIASLTDEVCLVFVFDTAEFRPDRRIKAVQSLLKHINAVEFAPQPPDKLAAWTVRRVNALGREITSADAAYLAERSGGLMTALARDVEKIGFHGGGLITRGEIDALVEPTPDAKSYELTDAVAARNASAAFRILGEMLEMREPGQVIVAAISRSARKLYAARQYADAKIPVREFMADTETKFEWQAEKLFAAARKVPAEKLRLGVLACCDAALAVNSGAGTERLAELVAELIV